MSIYQRPLFMQAGGAVMQPPQGMPMAPEMGGLPPMQPDMGGLPPELAQQAAIVEQEAAGRVQELGGQYIDDTMMNLDAAETPEDVINAIRGNQMPIAARYQELAQLVGEQDASATPESVLALVQPTILMTEQGAMDSGVGALMQGLVGEVDMAFPDGAPTDMGQGLGGLMMAGAPAEPTMEPAAAPMMGVGQPPVANFSQGGMVQRFQAGGEASRLQALYSDMLPVYQSILGDGEDQRRMTQAQILFDIADRAGAFAAGIDPRTGQRVQGSPAAQLAAAASGLGGQIGERLGAQDQQDRQLRAAALQAAQGEFSAERADQRAAARAAAAGTRDRALGNLYDIVDAEGNVVQQAIPIATQSEYAALMENVPGGRIRPSTVAASPAFSAQTLYGSDGEVVTVNVGDPEGIAEANALIGQGFTDKRPDGFKAQTLFGPEGGPVTINIGNAAGARRAEGLLEQGFTTEAPAVGPAKAPVNVQMPDGSVQSLREDDPRLDDLIAEGGVVVSRTAAQRDALTVQPDLMARYAQGQTSPEETARIQAEIAQMQARRFNPETQEFELPEVTPLVRKAETERAVRGDTTVIAMPDRSEIDRAQAERELNLQELGGHAFGTRPFFQELVNRAFALVDADAPFREAEQATAAISSLNQDALIAFRDLTQGRTAQEAVNQFQNVLPNPAEIGSSPSRAASRIDAVLDFFTSQISNAQQALDTGVVSAAEAQRLQAAVIRGQQMADAYRAVRDGIVRGPRTNGRPDPSQFRR
jgi:hypothetical protein